MKIKKFKYGLRYIYTLIVVLTFFMPARVHSQQAMNSLSDFEKYNMQLMIDRIDTVFASSMEEGDSIKYVKCEDTGSIKVEHIENQIKSSINGLSSAINASEVEFSSKGLPLLKKEKPLSKLGFSVGVSASYYPVTDTNFLNSGIHKSYWINLSQTVYGLPLQFGAATGDGVNYSADIIKMPVQFNFNFDYQQYLLNVKQGLINQYEEHKEDIYKRFEQIHFTDSLQAYNLLKDTLANTDYLVYIGKLKDKKKELLDSINNCYVVDSAYLHMIDSTLACYAKYRAEFNRMVSFLDSYYSMKSKYDDYEQKVESVKQTIESTSDLKGLLNSSNQYGLSPEFSQWPLHFKKFQVGAQFINHTPLTFQNYISNGIAIDYNNDKLIIKADVLTQNWFSPYSIATGEDSLVNIFQNNQSAYITGIGFGDPDSSYILLTTAFIKERTQASESKSSYSNLLFSFYQKARLVDHFYLEYEIAKSEAFIYPHSPEADTAGNSNLMSQAAIYAKLAYELQKSKTEISADESLIGLSYISIANPFIHPGTVNSGAGIKQSFLKSKLSLSYKITFSNTINENPQDFTTYYHLAQLDYMFGKIGSFHIMLSPYQYNYSVEGVTNSNSKGASNFITCYSVVNIPLGKSNITSVINYSNFTTQSSFTDTIVYMETNTVSSNTTASVFGRAISLNTIYYIPVKEFAYAFVNSADLKVNILNKKNIYLDFGPKWLGYKTFNDQFGGSTVLTARIGKYLNWSFMLDKYFEVEHIKDNYTSNIFFTTAFSIILN